MILSPAHTAARAAAARLPALQASFNALVAAPTPAEIRFYDNADPDAVGAAVIATVTLADAVGAVDEATYRINPTVPREGQVATTAAALSARVFDGTGAWWGDATVSDTAGAGEIKLQDVSLVVGSVARITAAYFQG